MQHLATKHNDAAKSRDARKVATEEKKRKHEEERNLQLQKKKEHNEAKVEKARERELTGLKLRLVAGGMSCKLA
jgi:hypothetical protein